MRAVSPLSIFALAGILLLSGCAAHRSARTYVTREKIDGRETTFYHAISKEYQFASKGLYANQEYTGLQTLLFEISTHTTWYQGMDGIKSQVHVAAFLTDRHGNPKRQLWVIQHEGHEFWHSHSHDPHVYILERACCDGLDHLTTYNTSTGEFIETHEVGRNVSLRN